MKLIQMKLAIILIYFCLKYGWKEVMRMKRLMDWELEKGIIVKDVHKDKLLSEKQYRRLIKTSDIKITTEKGLEYYKTFKR